MRLCSATRSPCAASSTASSWQPLRPQSPSLIGAVVAYLDLRTTLRGRRLLDYLAILPLGLPGTVMAVGILLAFIRLPVPIYGTIWILLAAYVARFIPLATRSANATFRQIDPSLEEAGRVTGAHLVARDPAHPVPAVAPGAAGRVPAGVHPGLQRAQRHDPALHRRHRDHCHRHLPAQRSGPARGRLCACRLHDRRRPDAGRLVN